MKNRKENVELMATRLKELECEIQKLEVLADAALADIKADYQNQIEALFFRKETLKQNLKKFQESGENAWEEMKSDNEISWEVFKDSVKQQHKKP